MDESFHRYVLDPNLAPDLRGFPHVIAKTCIWHDEMTEMFAHADDIALHQTPSRDPQAFQPLQVSEAMPRDAMCDAEDPMALERLDAKWEPCAMPKTPRLMPRR